MRRTWQDVEEIGLDLFELHPDLDPISVSLPEIKEMVVKLSGFDDDPDGATDVILEAIQESWYDEYED